MNRTNAIRNPLLSLMLAASAFAAPAYAQVSFHISLAPPAPQYEIVPALSPGHVWAPGYWGWSGERHVWVRGRSIVQREGYRWEPDRWEQRDRNYYHTAGHWQRDNDYRTAKVKKEKKLKDRDSNDRGGRGNGNHGRHNNGKHGGGGKHNG